MLTPGDQVDRYTVLGELGQGGMASVYQVRHTNLGSDHVLKVLTVPGTAVRERLLLEGQVQARLKHPNVVEVTDVVEVHGAPGLVMELVRGPSLDVVLEQAPLALQQVDDLVPGILAGVGAAHEQNVVHRDLKPANILLATRKGRIQPKVADFGLVKMLAADPKQARTRTGSTMGTPQYMAPEQIENSADVDAKADIWALGAILYELVTGRRAFEADSHFEIFKRVVAEDFVPVRQLRPDAPDRMVQAIDAALTPRAERTDDVEVIWALWNDGAQSLDAAAATPPKWTEQAIEHLANLAPASLLPSDLSHQPTAPSSPPATTPSETFFDDTLDPPSTLVVDAPAPSPPPSDGSISTRARVGLVVGGGALAAIGAVVIVVTLLGGWWFVGQQPVRTATDTPSPAAPLPPQPDAPPVEPEPSSIEPAPVEPAPAPVEPAPAPVEPAPADPAPADPAPVAPPEVPAPAVTPPRPIAPVPTIPKPPPTSNTGHVRVIGGTVKLSGPNGKFAGGDVPPGTYKVFFVIDADSVAAGTLTVVAGGEHTVECRAALRSCAIR